MRLGLLSDAHGNPAGLRACLEVLRDRERVDRLCFLGDAVGYLPGAAEVVALLRSEEIVCLKGNHDAMLLGELPLDSGKESVYRIEDARARLDRDDLSFLRGRPSRLEVTWHGRRLLLVHGSPWDPLTGYIYPDGELARFEGLEVDAVGMGHTHRPFVALAGATLVVNAGSCGLPRDRGDLASCAVVDLAANTARILRVPFDDGALLRLYGDEIHPAVAACLGRRPEIEPEGEVVA